MLGEGDSNRSSLIEELIQADAATLPLKPMVSHTG